MGKFNIGDRVRMIDTPNNRSYFNQFFNGIHEHIVRDFGDDNTLYFEGYLHAAFEGRVKLISRPLSATQEAMKLLIDQGYSITPPEPKRNGKAVIYRWVNFPNGQNEPQVVMKDVWDKQFKYDSSRTDLELIAIVDWQEGQGLTEGDGL